MSFGGAHHAEVILVTVEIRHKDDAGLIEARRSTEEVASEWDRRAEDCLIACQVPSVESTKGRGCSGSNRVKDAEEGIAMSLSIAANQCRVIEVIAGVHPYAGR